MLNLPFFTLAVIDPFAQAMWGETTWARAQEMVVGALLTTGKRTVSSVLRVLGLGHEANYARYHAVLNRAVWSGLEVSLILLRLLIKAFAVADEPLVFGIDETIERRRGAKIAAKGIYRDPVRSSKSHFVKASGLRWVCLMWLVNIPFAQRVWALPFLTMLAASERYYQERGRSAKKITDWARQAVFQLRRWLPNQALVVVADSGYAALDFLHACQSLAKPVTVITRLRLDAALYEPTPAYSGKGRPRKKGKRLPTLASHLTHASMSWQRVSVLWYDHRQRDIDLLTGTAVWYHTGLAPVPVRYVLIRDVTNKFAPQALLSTDLTLTATVILALFMRRWQMETTFQQVRTHLGVETQRQWSAKAIARTTPALLGLFSVVTLLTHELLKSYPLSLPSTAWYTKTLPTFADALALVRRHFWRHLTFQLSAQTPDMVQVPRILLERFTDALCYAA